MCGIANVRSLRGLPVQEAVEDRPNVVALARSDLTTIRPTSVPKASLSLKPWIGAFDPHSSEPYAISGWSKLSVEASEGAERCIQT